MFFHGTFRFASFVIFRFVSLYFVTSGFDLYCSLPFGFVTIRLALCHLVFSTCYVSFRFVTLRFVSCCTVLYRFVPVRFVRFYTVLFCSGSLLTVPLRFVLYFATFRFFNVPFRFVFVTVRFVPFL